MRRILVESARRKGRARHGGNLQRVELDATVSAAVPPDDVLALDDALTALAREYPDKAELVKLRYFAGLTLDEAADCLGISPATAKRWWAVARAWLFDAMSAGPPYPPPAS
jgi:RNA polymerase sigma factor (TIGR02999 family)